MNLKEKIKSQINSIRVLISIIVILLIVGIAGAGYFGWSKYKQYQAEIAEKSTQEIDSLEYSEIEILKSSPPTQPKIIEKTVEKIIEAPPPTPQKSTTKLSNSEIIEKVKPAVVYIQTSDGSGSGMIIENNGYILTNAHVVSGVSSVKIKLSDGRLFIGSVIGRDEKIDLAILKLNKDNLPEIEFGNSDDVKQGDEVFTLGYPFGLEGDVSFNNIAIIIYYSS